MDKLTIIIGKGSTRFIYDDKLKGLIDRLGGESDTRRCSHVEPDGNQWTADLSPVGGPKLGPYALKQEALDAEVKWLVAHGLPDPLGV